MLILRYSVLLLALISGFCRADSPVVIVGYYDFPPSIYTAPDGHVEGPLFDLLTRMLKRGGYTPEFRGMPIARLYNELREGRVDLWAGAPSKEELKGYVLESDRPLAEVRLNLYYRPDTPEPNIPDDLIGRVMIMLSGYSYWPYTRDLLLDPSHEIIQLRTHHRASALELLRRKRGDYLLDYQLPIDQELQRTGQPPLPYVTVETLPIRLIVSRKSDDAPKLLQTLDQVFDQMRASGEDVALP
jgi:polar amino acid transport system substrate-binding protein